MPISLRLNSDLERELNKHARIAGKPKSELIRNLIADFVNKKAEKPTAWELGKCLFGRQGSGKGNLSVNRKQLLKDKVRAKKNRN